MAYDPDTAKQEPLALLAYRRQLSELCLTAQRRLSHFFTQGEYQASDIHPQNEAVSKP